MKSTVKIFSAILSILCLCAFFVSCGEKLSEDFESMERGDRSDFSEDAIVGCEHSYKIVNSGTKNLTITTEVDAFDKSFEYLNCKIVIRFTGTLIFEDMTETEIEETFVIELPFEGDFSHEYDIVTEKPVHSVYNDIYEIISMDGEIIKK